MLPDHIDVFDRHIKRKGPRTAVLCINLNDIRFASQRVPASSLSSGTT